MPRGGVGFGGGERYDDAEAVSVSWAENRSMTTEQQGVEEKVGGGGGKGKESGGGRAR